MSVYQIFSLIILVVVFIILLPLYRLENITVKQRRIFSAIIIIVFCIGSFGLYYQFGTPEILPLLAQREEKLSGIREKITTNSEILKKDPKSLKAWVEIGDSFMETSQFAAAANAYKQSILLSEGKPELIMSYVHALILGADGTVTPEAKKSLDIMLILQPENEQVRYFLAMYKMQSGDAKGAMEDMKRLYKSLADDSPVKALIDRQIGRK